MLLFLINNNYSKDKTIKYIDEYYNKWKDYYKDNDKKFGDFSTERNYSIINIKEYFDKRYDYITKGE